MSQSHIPLFIDESENIDLFIWNLQLIFLNMNVFTDSVIMTLGILQSSKIHVSSNTVIIIKKSSNVSVVRDFLLNEGNEISITFAITFYIVIPFILFYFILFPFLPLCHPGHCFIN